MTRILDLVAVLIVAVVLLLPQPSVVAYPAAQGVQADLDQLAALQDAFSRQPGDEATAIELARAYLAVEQPAWAVAILAPLAERGAQKFETHQVLAFAYATLLRPADALREAERGLAVCEQKQCAQPARIRLSYLAEMMRGPASQNVDPKKDPLRAKRLIGEALRATHAPVPPAAAEGSVKK